MVLGAIVLALSAVLLWPIRKLWKKIKGDKGQVAAKNIEKAEDN